MKIHDTASIRASASTQPSPGARKIPPTVLKTPSHTTADTPALAAPAPTSPPINACELDEGIPSRLVMTCQVIAPDSAPKITRASITLACTMPRPTVSATCRPNTRKAMKLKNAAAATAYCGRKTRVDTMVAMALAASFMPLRKSNASATKMRPISSGKASVAASIVIMSRQQSDVFDDDAVQHIGDVIEAIDNFLQMIIDFVADEKCQATSTDILLVKFA